MLLPDFCKDGTEPRQGSQKCMGQSYAVLPVLLRLYSMDDGVQSFRWEFSQDNEDNETQI
jgi:hypothetical protein